jgi:hypothetical protein
MRTPCVLRWSYREIRQLTMKWYEECKKQNYEVYYMSCNLKPKQKLIKLTGFI